MKECFEKKKQGVTFSSSHSAQFSLGETMILCTQNHNKFYVEPTREHLVRQLSILGINE